MYTKYLCPRDCIATAILGYLDPENEFRMTQGGVGVYGKIVVVETYQLLSAEPPETGGEDGDDNGKPEQFYSY